jgi:uncharacterized protein with gpF-like domain
MTAIALGKGFATPHLSTKPVLTLDAKPEDPVRRRGTVKSLRPVRPNAGITAWYQRRLDRLIDKMADSVQFWVEQTYARNVESIRSLAQDADLAMDASPVDELVKQIRNLRRRWLRRFDRASEELARHFAKKSQDRTDADLRKILHRAGMTVEFTLTDSVRNSLKAIVQENVSLIRSIPQKYLTDVEGLVMRSVVAGRDLGPLAKELRAKHGVTKRRAAFIALDQNNKATSAVQRIRYLDVGITKGIWNHSYAGREPRPTHLANDGKEFDVAEGWYDPDPRVKEKIWPGQLINCRCTFSPVLD